MLLDPRPNLFLPHELYQRNAADIAGYVRRLGLDCALVCGHSVNDLGTQIYGDGMERLLAGIVMPNGDIHWVVPMMEVDHMIFRQAPCAPAENITGYEDQIHIDPESSVVVDSGLKTLVDKLQDLGCQKVLVEPHMPSLWTSYLNYGGLKTDIDQYPFVQMLQIERGLHPAEELLMHAALGMANYGMDEMLKAVAAGQYNIGMLFGLDKVVKGAMMKLYGFHITDCKVLMGAWPGPESHMSHYIPHLSDSLRPGFANIGFIFPTMHRYWSEIERLILIGPSPQRLQDIYAVVREATQAAMDEDMFRVGTPVSDLDEMVHNHIAQRLGSEGIHHRSGHRIKTAHHFPGSHGGIVRGSKMLLGPGYWAWEPGFSDPELGAIRNSVPFRITNEGKMEWLGNPVPTIEELTIPQTTPVQDPMVNFMEHLPAIEKALRAKLAAL